MNRNKPGQHPSLGGSRRPETSRRNPARLGGPKDEGRGQKRLVVLTAPSDSCGIVAVVQHKRFGMQHVVGRCGSSTGGFSPGLLAVWIRNVALRFAAFRNDHASAAVMRRHPTLQSRLPGSAYPTSETDFSARGGFRGRSSLAGDVLEIHLSREGAVGVGTAARSQTRRFGLEAATYSRSHSAVSARFTTCQKLKERVATALVRHICR